MLIESPHKSGHLQKALGKGMELEIIATNGHLAQLDLLQAIKKSTKNKVALSMEMFETDVQLVLNEYLEGKISEDVFVKDARAWPKYSTDYKPLVEAMKSDGLHVIAANAPRRYVKMVTKNGLSALDKLSFM